MTEMDMWPLILIGAIVTWAALLWDNRHHDIPDDE